MKVADLFGPSQELDWGGYAACRDEQAQAGAGPAAHWLEGQTGAGPGVDVTGLVAQGGGGGYTPKQAAAPHRMTVENSIDRRSS